jgi:hypothetical protein
MCDLVHLSQGFFVAEHRTEANARIIDEEAVAGVTTNESRVSTASATASMTVNLFFCAFDLSKNDDLRQDPLEVCNASIR